MAVPFGLLTTRPKGPETGANQPVSGKGYFRLTHTLIFGKLGIVEITKISRLRAGQHGPPLAGFSVSRVGVPLRTVDDARESIRVARKCV
jgi:hypothetical protein